jgi:hypothetical protein
VTASPEAAPETLVFTGRCDGSGAVSISGSRLIAVVDDETSESGENRITLYDGDRGGVPVRTFPLNALLGIADEGKRGKKEADFEAAARLNDTIYWLGSHARNKEGEKRPARHQLFAFTLSETAGEIKPVGKAYHDLLDDLLKDNDYKPILKKAEERGPEEKDGLSIEGLSATPEGNLLIAFRNPIPNGKALLAPLTNPLAVAKGTAKAKFAKPILLDISEGEKKRAIRDIVYWPENRIYLLIAGSYLPSSDSDAAAFALYTWSGKRGEAPKPLSLDLTDLNPEGILLIPGEKRRFQIHSDDGSRDECKDKPENEQSFRAVWRELPGA